MFKTVLALHHQDALNVKQKASVPKVNLAAFRHDKNKRGTQAKHERENLRSLSCASKSPTRNGGKNFSKGGPLPEEAVLLD